MAWGQGWPALAGQGQGKGGAEGAGPLVVGVDLGGTKIAAGLVAQDGAVRARVRYATPVGGGPAAVLEKMAEAVRETCRSGAVGVGELAAVCVAAPGPVDAARGVVVRAPNLGWREVEVSSFLEAGLGVPVFLENDANAAALGEWWVGAGRGTRHFVYVTVSTGIGSGIVLEGRLYVGAHGAAGELGHTVVVAEGGPLCGCGQRGCLEALASGSAIARRAREALAEHRWPEQAAGPTADDAPGQGGAPFQGQPGAILWRLIGGDLDRVDARLVGEAARRGDPLARAVLEGAWRYLGAGLVSLLNWFDPEVVAIGGGVSALGELMLEPLRRYTRQRAVAGPAQGTRIVLAELGPDAGVVGAAAVAFDRLGLRR